MLNRKLEVEPRKDKFNRVILNPDFDILGTFRKVPHKATSKRKVIFKPPREYEDTWIFKREIGSKTLYIKTYRNKFYICDDEQMHSLECDTSLIVSDMLESEKEKFERYEIFRQVGELQTRLETLKRFLLKRRWDDLRKVYKERGVEEIQE